MPALYACMLFVVLVAKLPAQTVTVGDTRETSSGGGIYQLSGSETFAFGQTFRTPDATSTSLSFWSVWLNAAEALADPNDNRFMVPVTLKIFDWSMSRDFDSQIFASDPVTPTDPTLQGTQTTFDIGVTLDPTKLYIAMLFPTGLPSTPFGTWQQAGVSLICITERCGGSDQYTDGQVWGVSFLENGEVDRIPYDSFDMRFEAQFDAPPVTATPEPASMTLMATGLVSVFAWGRRRRKNARGEARSLTQ